MATRCSLASYLIASTVLAFLPPQVRAADEPAAAARSPVWTGLVPDDAFAAIVLYPQRVLTSASLAKFDIKSLAGNMANESGISPLDIEQLAILVGPPRERQNGREEKQFMVVGRVSNPLDRARVIAKGLGPLKTEEAEIAGHKYTHFAKQPNIVITAGPGLYFVDDRTFLFASESWLPRIFDSTNARSTLISALASADPTLDATLVFSNTDAAKEVIERMAPTKSLAGPLKPIGELPELIQAAKLGIRINPEVSLKLMLVGKDDESADKLEQMIKSYRQLGQAFLPALQAAPGEQISATQRRSREFVADLAKKLVDGLVPDRKGKRLTVEIGNLGTVDLLAANVVLPAVTAARIAAGNAAAVARKKAARIGDEVNIRQLALAMEISKTESNHFPTRAIYSKEGKPLLSWRVSMLPYLEQEELFKQFHLDEPWDSPNNKPLIAKMPAVFKSPSGNPLAAGQTRYVVPFGKDTIFDGTTGIAPEKITDGDSNTISILQVGEDKAVTWTKPDDMDFDPKKPLAGVGTIGEDGILAAFADGHARTIRKDVDAETFRRLIIRNDGLPVDPNKL